MFDANLAYYDGPLDKLLMVHVQHIRSDSKLFSAGARKGKKYIARRTTPPEQEGENCLLLVCVGGTWVSTNNSIDCSIENLIFAGVAPLAPEMFTKETYPLNQTGFF